MKTFKEYVAEAYDWSTKEDVAAAQKRVERAHAEHDRLWKEHGSGHPWVTKAADEIAAAERSHDHAKASYAASLPWIADQKYREAKRKKAAK